MPITTVDFPAEPECGGKQWSVSDQDDLAHLCALVLIGRALHVRSILHGSMRRPGAISAGTKARLRDDLSATSDNAIWQRDGLLFEIITWIVACINAGNNDVVSDPHLKSTQQGIDTLQIVFNQTARSLEKVVVYEQKCTDRPRTEFRDSVLPAFETWKNGERDNELLQNVTGLLARVGLQEDEALELYDKLLNERPLSFQATLTVTPTPFAQERCVRLFKDYQALTADIVDRLGDTFPLASIRTWFSAFADRVREKIEAMDV
jgi:hypothetical protein